MTKEYDIIILGRGAAAFSAAIKASEITYGEASIAMIGEGPLGGTCVNVGCVPSKYLLEASRRIYDPSHPRMPGITPSEVKYDFESVMEGLEGYVTNARNTKYAGVIKNYRNVTVYEGLARFVDNRTIEINNRDNKTKYEITGQNVLIATGSRPSIPNIDGLNDSGYMTSDTVWKIRRLPQRIAVIGGGAIGLEIGQAFLNLGSEVTVIEALDSLLPQTEPEIGQILQQRLEGEGMKFHFRTRVISAGVENENKYVDILTHKGRERITVSDILVATGRAPNSENLNLEKAGVKTDAKGQIITDRKMMTSSPGIYAAGDCVSKRMFLETLAAREGAVAVSNMFGQNSQIDYESSVWAIFTNPQVAGVGMTEREFSLTNKACTCRTFYLSNLTKAGITGETEGIIKITVNPSDQKIVGMHMISPNATDIITEGAYAVRNGFTYEDIIARSHIFPSYSEAVKLTAQSFIRDISKMSCCVE
jgi:mercuric reductase